MKSEPGPPTPGSAFPTHYDSSSERKRKLLVTSSVHMCCAGALHVWTSP